MYWFALSPVLLEEVEKKDVGRRGGVGMRMMVLIRIWVDVCWMGRPPLTRGRGTASDTLSADRNWIFKNRV